MSGLSGFVKRLRDIMRNDAGINGDAQRIEQIAWLLFLKVYAQMEEDWEFDEGEGYESVLPQNCRWESWAHEASGKGMTGDELLGFVNGTLFPSLKNLAIGEGVSAKKAIVKEAFEDANNYMKDGVLLRQVVNTIDSLDFADYEQSSAFAEIYEAMLKELQSAGSSGEFYTPRAVTDFMAHMIQPKIGDRMADFACGTGGFITSWMAELEGQVKNTQASKERTRSFFGAEKKPFPYMLCVTNMLLHGFDEPNIRRENSLLRNVLDYTDEDRFDVILMNPPYGGAERADVKSHFPADLASSETADLFVALIMYRLKVGGRAAVILPDGFLFGADNAKVAIKRKMFAEFNVHTVIRLPSSVFSPYTSIATNIVFFERTGATRQTWFYRLDMPEGMKHFSKTRPMRREHFVPAQEWWGGEERKGRQEIRQGGFDKARCLTAGEIAERGFNMDVCGFPHEEEEILAPQDLIAQYRARREELAARADEILRQIERELGLSGAHEAAGAQDAQAREG